MLIRALPYWFLAATLISSLFPASARADSDLTLVMKKMGADLRKVMDQVAEPELNSASAAACADILGQITAASNFIPDSFANLPSDKRSAALLQYREGLSELSTLVTLLKHDFDTNDNASAAKDLRKVIQQRNNGHQAFAPDEDGEDLDFPGAGLVAHCFWVIGPSLTDEAILQIAWTRKADGAPVNPTGGFAVALVMPSMPEMNNPPVQLSPIKGKVGVFQARGLYFLMEGAWRVNISLGRETSPLDLSVSANP